MSETPTTETELAALEKQGGIDMVEEPETPAPLDASGFPAALEPYIKPLQDIRLVRRHLTAEPTLIPKSFVEQIQLYDDGTSRRLYLYINNAWRFAPLGGAYGEIYGSVAKTLTLTNASQWYLIGDANGVGSNGLTAGGVTVDQGNWRITPVAGNYRVTLTVSFSVDRICKLDIAARQAGADLPNVYSEFNVAAVNVLHTVSVSGLAALSTGSLNPQILTDTAGAVVTFERINLHITSI